MIRACFGLGNPGRQYDYTPHNAGFALLDTLCDQWSDCKNGLCARVQEGERLLWLVKPQTYMNQSGLCVQAFLQKNGIKGDETVVVYDDADIAPGRVRLAFGGSSRGHNGLRSITSCIGERFWRLGVGVGRDARMGLGDFVLKRMPLAQWEVLVSVFSDIYNHKETLFDVDEQKAKDFVREVNGR